MPEDKEKRVPRATLPPKGSQGGDYDLLRAIIEGTSDSVFAKDLEGRYVLVNSTCASFIGKSKEEITGRRDEDLYPPETAARFTADDRVVLETGKTLVFEGVAHRAVPDESGAQPYRVTKGLVRDASGVAVGVFGISHDMTERMRAEEERVQRARAEAAREEAEAAARSKDELLRELRESEERYRSLLENANDIIYSHDLEGNYITINRACERITGYTREEILGGLNVRAVVAPEHLELARRMTEQKLRDPSPTVYEIDIITKTGRRLTLEVSTRIARREGRDPVVEGIARDVTERRRAQEALRQSEERFSRAFESSPLALTISSLRTGHLLEVNETFTRLSGYAREEAIGRTTLELGLWAKTSERQAGLATLAQGGHVRDSEQRFRMKDGGERVGRVSAELIEVGGEPCVLTVIQDITAQKLAEAEREQLLEREKSLRARAEEANRMKDEFLATLSHELRTPLTSILGWAHMLDGGSLDDATARRAVGVIRRNAEHQRQLVEDILDASRIVTGKLKVEARRIQLTPVVYGAIEAVRPAAEAKGVELTCAFDPAAEAVTGDAHRLQQVVWNLLSNAVKFTPAGGRVKVSVERMASHVRVTVSDTGEGIEPEFLPHVFERFRQADGSTTRRHGGLGLGLSIVRYLVEAHGGAVHAYSAGAGRGATFTVELPLAAEQLKGQDGGRKQIEVTVVRQSVGGEGARVGESDVPPALVGLRVLLVDDDEDTLRLLAHLLKGHGAQVEATASAAEALAALPTFRPDVIVSDIGMSGEDGYAFMRRVRASGADGGGLTPAIALTAYAGDTDRDRALAAGFQLHMAKPVDPLALVAAVNSLAGKTEPAQ